MARQVAMRAARAASRLASGVTKRFISFDSTATREHVARSRALAPTTDATVAAIEAHEDSRRSAVRSRLTERLASIPAEHDIHRVTGYRERFIAAQVEKQAPELHVKYSPASPPHYDLELHQVSLMDRTPAQHDQVAHEMTHALDHMRKDVDLSRPDERLASELSAFSRQQDAALEASGKPPAMFEGRSPQQMAESYHGKEHYPGTLDSSIQAVRKRHAERGGIFDRNSEFAQNLRKNFSRW